MHTTTTQPILVLGGTGKTGRRVAERLSRQGVPVRIGSRTGAPPFRWEDPETWGPVLDGMTAAYLCFHPDLAVPGAADTVGALARQAARGGVRRLVLLSGRGEEEARRAEQAVQAAGADWTIVRCSFFAQDFSEDVWRDDVLAGTVALPVGGVLEPFVDAEDVADVAAAALVDPRHAGRVYELTGPELLSFGQAVDEIAAACGRDVRFAPVAPDAYSDALAAHGVPADVVALLHHLFTQVLDGRNAHLADGVQRALGREPGSFRAFARRAAATGAWQPAPAPYASAAAPS